MSGTQTPSYCCYPQYVASVLWSNMAAVAPTTTSHIASGTGERHDLKLANLTTHVQLDKTQLNGHRQCGKGSWESTHCSGKPHAG